jgi:hypothetical protein
MAKSTLIGAGSLELNTIDASTDHAVIDAFTVYGVFGIQIWVTYKPKTTIEDYPDYKAILRQQERLEDEEPRKSLSTKEKSKKVIKGFDNKKAFLRYLLRNEGDLDDSFNDVKKQPKRVKEEIIVKPTKKLKKAPEITIKPLKKNDVSSAKNIKTGKKKTSSKSKVEKLDGLDQMLKKIEQQDQKSHLIQQEKQNIDKKEVAQTKSSKPKKDSKKSMEKPASDIKPENSKKGKTDKVKTQKPKNK